MRVFLENWNGVLDLVEDTLKENKELTTNPHEADIFLTWQDIRGDFLQLAEIVKYHLKKPLIVMQHGRGAVRDYGAPNKFRLLADKILVWGQSEKTRLLSYGITEDKIEIVGCPILPRLKPKERENPGKNILFVPVISHKEEPENILVYATLKKWESEKLIKNVYTRFDDLKRAWSWQHDEFKMVPLPDGTNEKRLWKRNVRPIIPRWATYEQGLINVKLSGSHDPYQYQAPQIGTPQNHPNLIDDLSDLLPNIDAMVCLEEGSMQLFAAYLDIPIIVCDIFKYQNYGGCKDYDLVEKIHTNACYWTKDINKIGGLLDHALANPKELAKHRKTVCEIEGGTNLQGDVNGRIIEFLRSEVQRNQRDRVQEAIAA